MQKKIVHGLEIAQSSCKYLKHMKRILMQESEFDGARCKIRKVLSTGPYETSIDLLEQKSN